MHSQERDWDVGYGRTRSPLDDKLAVIGDLICFRIQFFGGVVEVIARSFLVEEEEHEQATTASNDAGAKPR